MFLTQATVIEGYAMGALALLAAAYGFWRLEKVGPQ
jgi:hypothetical protein